VLSVEISARLGKFELAPSFSAGNELVVLCGPSGSGKSLTLQAIAGILRPDSGRITVGDRVLYDGEARVNVPVQSRRVGYVPQGYALFPHLSVAENIAFGLRDTGRADRRSAVESLIATTGLSGMGDQRPHQLSGGQQQRVALARALACRPRILLLDEPFSALDTAIRAELRDVIVSLHESRGIPTLIVTHDLGDAFSLGSRIIVIEGGRALQQGPREDIFYRPATRRVAELVGTRNVLPMTVCGLSEGVIHLDWAGRPIAAAIYATHDAPPLAAGQRVEAAVRPTQIMIRRPGDTFEGRVNVFAAQIAHGIMGAENYRIFVKLPGSAARHDLEIDLPAYTYFRLGLDHDKDIEISIRPEAVHIIHSE
jgi:molybdate transport system ATP-binding protein